MAMLMTNATAAHPTAYVPPVTYTAPPTQIFAAPPLQGLYTPRGGGRGGACSQGGRGRSRGRGNGAPGQIMLPPLPYVGGTGIIPYIPAGIQPPAQPPANPRYSNITKSYTNQNVCYSCGFDVEDWHTSATCNRRKTGHQEGFTRSNYMEYERANHPFCKKPMHKTMHPSPF